MLVQCGDEPIVHAGHRDLATVQNIDDMPAGLASVVNLESVAVRLVLYDNPTAASAQCVR